MRLAILPYWTKFLGMSLIIIAIPFAYIYFFEGKPDILNVKTFAFVTTYAETKYFVWSQTNIADELAAVFFISGLSMVSFSKEKNELPSYEALRLKALVLAFQVSLMILILAFLVVYGIAIFVICATIFFIFIILYNVLFRYYLIRL